MSGKTALAVCVLAGAIGVWAPQAAGQQYHDCVVIILDASGSMQERMGSANTRKMAAAKQALKEVLTQLPEQIYVGLLILSGKNVQQNWAYPLGPRDDTALVAAIDMPQPGGNTPLGAFIKLAGDRLIEERTKQFGYGTYRMLIVTDGQATDGNLTDTYTPDVLSRGIVMDVIGVDMAEQHTLATRVHSYRRADDPEALKQAIAEVMAEVSAQGSDDPDAEAFDLLAPIPAEMASAMLEALTRADNAPIGQGPAKQLTPLAANGAAAPPKGAAKQAPPAHAPASPAPPPAQPAKKSGFYWQVLMVIVIATIVIGRRSRRRRG